MREAIASLFNESASGSELVLPYRDAIAALETLQREGIGLLGWEGWLRGPDGQLGHSGRFQGTTDLSSLNSDDAYALCHATIRQAQEQYIETPERESTELLFCLSIEDG